MSDAIDWHDRCWECGGDLLVCPCPPAELTPRQRELATKYSCPLCTAKFAIGMAMLHHMETAHGFMQKRGTPD